MNTTFIWTDLDRCGGKPCIKGSRFSVSQLLAELADRGSLASISENFDLPLVNLQGALHEVACYFGDHPILGNWKASKK